MRLNLSLWAGVLSFGLVPPVDAQPLNCTVSANALGIRLEGATEPIGDVFIQCAANDRTPAGQAYVTGDVKILINTNIVNRLLGGGAADVVLIVNENHAPPTSASTLGGPLRNFPVPQFGQIVAANALQWSAVKIPIPGATAPDGSVFPSRTTLRITNMRVNASQLGLSSTLVPTVVAVFAATIADAAAVPTANAQLTLPIIGQGLLTGGVVGTLPQCQSQNIVNGAVNGPTTFSVRLREGFEYAFRPLGQPTTDTGIRAGEDGYPTPGIGANGGGVDQGTRLLIRLNNIGTGVRIAVPATITNGALSLQLLVNNSLTGAGPYQPVAGNGLVELTGTGGTVVAVYEVVKSDNTVIETVDIPFVVGYTANPGANLPAPGFSTVNASFAPLTTVNTSSSTAPVPRFADYSFARNAFSINVCTAPPPMVSGVRPNSLPAATGMDAVLRVDGSGFSSDSVVEWNGTPLQTMLGRDANVFLSALVTASLTMQPGTAQLDVSNADGQRSNRVVFTITRAPPPAVNSGGAVNAASSQAILTRGGLASLYGIALATSTASASGFPLPTVLTASNVKVTVNGFAAPLIYVSPSQINFQVPFEVPLSGTATIVVTRDGINSAAATAGLAEFAPGIFRASIGPILLHSDYSLVTQTKPAAPGEVLIAYGTGLGGLNSPPATGSATPANPVVTARLLPAVTIGGQTAEVQFAGLASGFAGLAQFNFRVPPTLPPGSLQILVLGYGSNTDSVPLAVLSSATGQITSLNPSSAPALSSGITLTVSGTGFTNSAVVRWILNGQTVTLSTTFVSSTMLTARIPGNLLTGQGTALITVLNGNGGSSNALSFTITPPPALASLNPSSVVAGATGFTLAVTGTNFTPSSVVRWGGTALPTTFVSGSKLFAAVSNSAVSSVGTASITVADTGVTSNLLTVGIVGSFGASFGNQVVTKEAPPASGCARPAAQTSFSVAAGIVFLYYEAMVTMKDSLNNDWLAPDGTVVPDSFWSPTSGNFCFTGGMLKIPPSPLGAWEGRVYDNGALLFAVPFSIVGSTAAGDSHN